MAKRPMPEAKRPYDLGKRLEQMDQSRAAILRAARSQLSAHGYQRLTMASLAAQSGVTRQTIHNLFGTKAAVLEALFDLMALEGGMDSMRAAMTQPSGDAMLEGMVRTLCNFWARDRVLHRRIHGIGAIDPEFGAVIEARNARRRMAASHIVARLGCKGAEAERRTAILAALTSFEFYDAIAGSCATEAEACTLVLSIAGRVLSDQC